MNKNDKVMELDIECIKHSKEAYTYEELEQLFWSGEMTGITPFDDQEFIPENYGYDYCDKCNKWIGGE